MCLVNYVIYGDTDLANGLNGLMCEPEHLVSKIRLQCDTSEDNVEGISLVNGINTIGYYNFSYNLIMDTTNLCGLQYSLNNGSNWMFLRNNSNDISNKNIVYLRLIFIGNDTDYCNIDYLKLSGFPIDSYIKNNISKKHVRIYITVGAIIVIIMILTFLVLFPKYQNAAKNKPLKLKDTEDTNERSNDTKETKLVSHQTNNISHNMDIQIINNSSDIHVSKDAIYSHIYGYSINSQSKLSESSDNDDDY